MVAESHINSKDNPQIKLLKKLSQKKYRYKLGKFFVENATIINDTLRSGHDFNTLFVTEEFKNKYPDEYDFLTTHTASKNIFIINKQLNKYFSCLETPSGIAAIYDIKQNFLDEKQSLIYLNAINDPGNLGTIMRTMLAFGFVNLVIDENCADIYNAKTISAAKDAIFKINILKDKECQWLKANRKDFPIYVSHVHEGTSLEKFKPAKKYCLVMGSESHGVSQEILEMSSEKIKIDMSGNIESLNVAIATAIFLYKLR